MEWGQEQQKRSWPPPPPPPLLLLLYGHGMNFTGASPVTSAVGQANARTTGADDVAWEVPAGMGCRRACWMGKSALQGAEAAKLEWSGQLMLRQPQLIAAATRW